ncbi:MAG: translation initiation factor IF-2 [archaeon]|nr:translation initiation factor IF-2 [archaeon]
MKQAGTQAVLVQQDLSEVKTMIRQPIITVLGHVDHGKTKLLDAIRGTAIAEKEAGAITQHIGATEVPLRVIDNLASGLLKKYGFDVKIPGLLFIDTPGHEAFTSLRERGGSIADLAVLVVDITQGFQPQTIEAINILKSLKTPFIVAANKIDLMHEWNSKSGEFSENLPLQDQRAKDALDEKIYVLVGKLFEFGFQSERFDRCNDFTKQIPIVPMSAKVGEGIPELLMLLSGLSQKFLQGKLEAHESEAGKGTILEIREERGLGKTIDVILYDGMIKTNQEIVVGGKNGIIKTKIRALLKPKPLREIRESGDKFNSVKEVHAASGIKIAAPDLDNALSGAPIAVVKTGEEAKAIEQEMASIRIETESMGAVLKADTLGALEALTLLLRKEGLEAKKADIGNITKNDVAEADSVKSKDPLMGVIFGFNVKEETGVLEDAKKRGIQVFSGNVVYKLIEDYTAWVNEKRESKKKEKLSELTLPVKMRFLRDCSFRNSKPAIIGVKILEGKIRQGAKIMNEEGKVIGKVAAIQSKNESIEQAVKGEEVAVSISGAVVGRTIEENDVLLSFIPQKQFSQFSEIGDTLNVDEKELLNEIKEIVEKNKEAEEE